MLVAQPQDFNTDPNIGAGPGGGAIQTLIGWLAGLALGGTAVAWLLGGAAVALGAFAHNYGAGAFGRRAVVFAAAGSFLVGAAATLNHFFWHIGTVFS